MQRMTKKEAAEAKQKIVTNITELCRDAKCVYVVQVHRSSKYTWSMVLLPSTAGLLHDLTWCFCRLTGQPVNEYGGLKLQRGGAFPAQEIKDMLLHIGVDVCVRTL